jgi:restriction endonuclease Mrr
VKKRQFANENEEDQSVSKETDVTDHRTRLLEIIKDHPPEGFERLCQRLLREAGFRTVTVTGQTGDGGIDGIGILKFNPFVSFNVLFQCKRYQGSVPPSKVRGFRGAMQGRADKGIILTTGTFTLEAKKEARRDGVPPIELIDGDALIDMVEQLELGLVPRRSFDVDPGFFEDRRQEREFHFLSVGPFAIGMACCAGVAGYSRKRIRLLGADSGGPEAGAPRQGGSHLFKTFDHTHAKV